MRTFFVAASVAVALGLLPGAAHAQFEAPTPIDELEDSERHEAQRDALDEVVGDEPEARPVEDPVDAPPPPARKSAPAARDTTPRASLEPILDEAPAPEQRAAATAKPAAATVPAEAPAAEPSGATAKLAAPKLIALPAAGDAELIATWAQWKKLSSALDAKGSEDARQRLLRLKQELAITDLEQLSVAFVRASQQRRAANDAGQAIELAKTAVELAPNMPYPRVALAHVYLSGDLTNFGRYASELKAAVALTWRDPRYLRPLLADLGAALLFAVMASAVAVIALLFARTVRYFLHDLHHLFPKAAARWQSAALAIALLSLPIVFHLGLTPTLLVLFAAITFYLSTRERAVAAVAIAVLGALPGAAGALLESTAFSGTVAEDVSALERGGLEAREAAARVRARMNEDKATFTELYALGRFELRRGQLDPAIAGLKKAAVLRTGEPRMLTTLGNALFAKGDAEGASQLYIEASQGDGALAAAWYNLSKVYYRKAATLPNELVGGELEKGQTAIRTAQSLDPTLLARDLRPNGVTEEAWEADKMKLARYLITPPLRTDEIASLVDVGARGEKVRTQVALKLLGSVPLAVASIYPLLGALAVFGLGFLRLQAGASRACDKCGRPVCRRCDPELGAGSTLCNQCVNVFARKNAVAPQVRARKAIEIEKYHLRKDRVAYVLGMFCSGAGHVVSGLPIRGALYVLLFAFLLFAAFFRHGVVRPPYDALPEYVRLIPIGLAFFSLYLFSLRGLYRRQTE